MMSSLLDRARLALARLFRRAPRTDGFRFGTDWFGPYDPSRLMTLKELMERDGVTWGKPDAMDLQELP